MSQLAALVEAQQEALVQQWTQRLREGLAPDDASEIELRDHIPSFLRELATVLRRGSAPESSSTAQEHGRQRYRLGFSLLALSREYTLLRHLIMDVAAVQSAAVTFAELRLLIDFIGTAIAEAIAEHARQRELAERTAAARHQQTVLERATWLSTTLETIGDAVITTSPSGKVTFLNPVAERLTGWADDAARGRPLGEVFRIIDERTRAALLSPVERVLTLGTVHGLDPGTSLLRNDGSQVAIEESASPIRSNDGELSGVVLVFRDVTSKKEIEAGRLKLAESEERLRRIVEAAETGTFALDLETNEITMDELYRKFAGIAPNTPANLQGRIALMHPDDQARVTQAVNDATAGVNNGKYSVEFRTTKLPDGRYRWVESNGQVDRDANGKALRILGISKDITTLVESRRKAETLTADLRESEERLRLIVAASGIGTWAMDLGNQTIIADERFHLLLGLPKGSLTFEAVLAGIHPDERGQVSKLFSEALEGGHGTSFTAEYRTTASAGGDGATWVETRGSVTASDPRAAPRLLGTVADTTERKRADTSLRRQSEFEQQLIGIVSHDLRNPLNAIKMGSGLLARREEFDERSKKTVLGIQSSTNRAIRLVNDLLDFTQARLGGGIRIERTPVDLHELLRMAVQEIEAVHPGRALSLKLEGDGRGSWDGDRLTQVIQNLVTNALKYSPPESTVDIAAMNDGEGLALSVHNLGAPIAPDRVSSIFQPLQRGTDQIDKTARSVGLGLYIVQAIVDAHAGQVIVTSTADEGTAFTVRLPRQPPARA